MAQPTPQELLRRLPPVNAVLDGLSAADRAYAPDAEWVEEIRRALAELQAGALGRDRARGARTRLGGVERDRGDRKRIARRRDPGLVRVVNATGWCYIRTSGARPAAAALAALAADGAGYQLLRPTARPASARRANGTSTGSCGG
jgi:hypothetical protein